MTSRKMLLLVLMYIKICLITVVSSNNFDSNVFIFWNEEHDIPPTQRVKIDNFFCMGIALHIQWILTPRICFENSIQLTEPETFSVLPIMKQESFDERNVNSSQVLEVKHILLNVTKFVNSGYVIFKLKDQNLLANKITKFASATELQEREVCLTLIWQRDSKSKYKLLPKIYKGSKSLSCTNLGTGDVCVASNITGRLCRTVASSLLQCHGNIQGISGYKINTDEVCRKANKQLPLIYADFSEHIFNIIIFLLSDKESEASSLSCSKALILTAVVISSYRLIKTAI